LGDRDDALHRIAILEAKLEQTLLQQKARVIEAEDFPMEFVGRTKEMAGLRSVWREVCHGVSRTAVITGTSGIGKTRLAREFLSSVAGEDTRTVSIKGTRAGMKLRWGVASDFIRALLRLPGSPGISPASDSLLRAMLPSMGRRATDSRSSNGGNPAAVLDAVMDLLESVTFEAPLAVHVDDFQWLDRDSRTLFMGLADRCRESRVLFLILGRPNLSSRQWDEVEHTLRTETGARTFHLEPLIEEEVGELLALGASFPDPADAALAVAHIYQTSAGNPFFIREILKELRDEGILVCEGPGWVFRTSEITEAFELPESLRELMKERLARLSEAASSVAATLAVANGRCSAENLRLEAQLPQAVFTGAVAELMDRGVIEWVEGTELDFVHDLLRDTAASLLAGSLPEAPTEPSWFEKHSGAMLGAVTVLVAAVGAVLWWAGALPWGPEPQPPLFGGGQIIFLRSGEPPFPLVVDARRPEEWSTNPSFSRIPEGVLQIIPGPGGGYRLFGAHSEKADGPDMTRILSDGTSVPLFPMAGDQTFHDLSPDQTRVLFTSERVGSDPFSHDLLVGEIATGATSLLFEGRGHLSYGRWSRDGDLVAFVIRGAPDTVAVSSLLRERVGEVAVHEVTGLSWCGTSLLVAATDGEDGYFIRMNPLEMSLDTLARTDPGASPSCSPDGTAATFVGIRDRRLAPFVLNLETGEYHDLPQNHQTIGSVRWYPDTPRSIPRGIRSRTDTVRIVLGEERHLSATVLLSDGSESDEGIRWESTNPDIASVGPYQELTGNAAGVTDLVARWGHSLRDTLVVVVEDEGDGYAFLREDFSELSDSVWTQIGSPILDLVSVDGGPALRLRGDEKYSDGLIYREPLPVPPGITVEAEIKIGITKYVHQNFVLCLRDIVWEHTNIEIGTPASNAEACVTYPAREFEKMDRSRFALTVNPGRQVDFPAPEPIADDGWIHLALQVRADGLTSLVVNRQRIGTSPVDLHTDPPRDWHILFHGTTVGTELFVRNLQVWPGERY
jgi:hypothetical protein